MKVSKVTLKFTGGAMSCPDGDEKHVVFHCVFHVKTIWLWVETLDTLVDCGSNEQIPGWTSSLCPQGVQTR